MNGVVVGTREERSKEVEPQIRAWPRDTIQSLKNKQFDLRELSALKFVFVFICKIIFHLLCTFSFHFFF